MVTYRHKKISHQTEMKIEHMIYEQHNIESFSALHWHHYHDYQIIAILKKHQKQSNPKNNNKKTKTRMMKILALSVSNFTP